MNKNLYINFKVGTGAVYPNRLHGAGAASKLNASDTLVITEYAKYKKIYEF